MDSCSKSEVTRLRRSACRWEDLRFKCRYLRAAPAIFRADGFGWWEWLGVVEMERGGEGRERGGEEGVGDFALGGG